MKTNYFNIVLILILFIFHSGEAQTLEWAHHLGGTTFDEGYAVAVDDTGNVYLTGSMQGTGDFDPGPGTLNLTSNGNRDIFITKLNSQGNLVWSHNIGGLFSDEGFAIEADASGNVYVFWEFNFHVDFDPGAGVFTLNQGTEGKVFLLKLDSQGNFVWAKAIGGPFASGGVEAGNSLKLDISGNLYINGGFDGTPDFDPGAGVVSLTSNGSEDIYVAKYNNNGDLIWVKGFGGAERDEAYFLDIDAAGNVYSTGRFRDVVDFDPGSGTSTLTSTGVYDVFVQKMDTDGNHQWSRSFGRSSSTEEGLGIAVDPSGNVFTTGTFSGVMDIDPNAGTDNVTSRGAADIFVQKLDSNGNYVWGRSFGSSSTEEVFSIDCDAAGNVYTTGFFQGRADFDPGAADFFITEQGIQDTFIHKILANGDFGWVTTLGSNLSNHGLGIVTDASNNVYTTGYMNGSVDFDPDPNSNQVLTSAGQTDIFIQKLNQNTASLDPQESLKNLVIYPNPTRGDINFEIPVAAGSVKISIFNSAGQLLQEKHVENGGFHAMTLSAPTGVYLVQIKSKTESKTFKLIKN